MTDLASAQTTLDAYSQAIQAIVAAVGPAVVRVQTSGESRGHKHGRHGHRRGPRGPWRHGHGSWQHGPGPWAEGDQPWPPGRARTNHGSGVIVDAEAGHIVTNYHVVRDADVVHVHLTDGTHLQGEVLGADPATDLAIIHVEADNLTAAEWGDSSQLQLGSAVLALGNPDGDTVVVTSGIVSALNRALRGPAGRLMEGLIQTDTIFNPGMSGGPLVNSAGQIVGINTASLVEAQGINLAISSAAARKLTGDLAAHGSIQRPKLGIAGERQRLYEGLVKHHDLKQTHGVYLHDVQPGSPAGNADLRKGDIIVGADAAVIEGLDDLHRFLMSKSYGDTLTLRLLRELDLLDVTVTLTPPAEQSA
jgi:S1-C subfamily serine protease